MDEYFNDAYGGDSQRRDVPMSHWLENSPWDPMAVNSPQNSFHTPPVSQAPSHTINPRANFAFHDWRSTGLPSASDCETIPGGDSGYGSLLPGHMDNSSIQGDDTITSSIPDVENELGGFHLTNHDTQVSATLQFTVADTPADVNTTSSSPPRPQQTCTECNAPLRTKSEMNKHLQRHKKPHTCSYPDCSRNTNGFASNNDLVRHKRTVHNETSNGRSFVCHHEPCIKKDLKLWPRADNFRSHLLRVHKIKVKPEDDLRDYVYQQQQQSQDLEGIGTNLQDTCSLDEEAARVGCTPRTSAILEFPEIPQSMSAASHLQAGVYAHNPHLLMPPNPYVNRMGGRRGFSYQGPRPQVMEDLKPILQSHSQPTRFQLPRQDVPKPIVSVNTTMSYSSPMEVVDQSPRQPALPTSVDAHTQPESENESDDDSKASVISSSASGSQTLQQSLDQLKGVKPAEQLEYLKQLPKEILQKALECQSQNSEDPNDTSSTNTKLKTSCTTCEKTFNRPCELRKHSKRHEKPYGCTWYQCNRKFGSKNDWKRHETNQHGQFETWHCPRECCEVFNNREGLKNHLQNDHKTTDSELLERNLEESRQGSHCTNSFWCGFCNKLVTPAPNEKISLTNRRFDHIDDHFMGRQGWKQLRIDEWHHMEDQHHEADRPVAKKTHLSETEGDLERKSKRVRAA